MSLTIKTERIDLKKFSKNDINLLFELDGDSDVMKYLSLGKAKTIDEVKKDQQISSKIETLADIGGAGFQISSKIGAGKVQQLYVNWLGNYYKIAVEINKFNQVIYEVCAFENIKFIDITPISRKIYSNPNWIAKDSLHPSKEQYSKWVEKIIPYF